ncbi:asparagine synthase (glutamine-hydrolyzing) [Terasakiella sp. A23]|uniref:asparagine synthase (glutamine-hydrolyzing) n=1 Tax=Terasakiella sp. FCG-A23 TaxID=3080561 RepID=UPI002952EEEB|nr:asparagine synthase (glutamine-hydrolyzing) [Terasakiella sp. A23]MDV7340836.1 asparagine synthase (glutamine-hydrolyzing) [Terasakiella sp. A23]
MCGIAGFYGPGDREDLQRMADAIRHRGPDGDGFYKAPDQPLHLAHLRLSIMDLEGGKQPMTNEDGTVWVTFNGEIYNHEELRAELKSKGHVFATDHSDTEVLVHGWEEWGEELPLKLNGMFGFSIYDQNQNCLFLARDRFGEKPLYWAQQGDLFAFGSELSVFDQHRQFKTAIDRTALKKFFAYGYIPSPYSFYQNCQKLKPGHWLRFDLKDQKVDLKAYWQFRINVADNPPSFDEAAEEIEHLLKQSVKRRLMSDVPLGVFLSGGVDSSAVAAAMCSMRDPASVKSFAIGFEEKSFDESEHARFMANALGSDHHEKILDFNQARGLIGDVFAKLDEPMGDGSLLPTYLLCEFARQKVTVALSGDAGDEIFAGYDPFKALKPACLYNSVMPGFAHKGMKALVDLIPKSGKNMSLDFKLRRVLMGLDYGPELWNPVWMSPLTKSDIDDLCHEPTSLDEIYGDAMALWQEDAHKGVVDKSLEFFTNFYLPDDILTKVDRAAMMNGLEARSIFLDNDLVDFARTLPAEYKFDGKTTKKVLKKAVERLVPQDILNRRKKGFGIPLMAWMKDVDLSASKAVDYGLNETVVAGNISAHQSGQKDYRFFLWNWMILQNFKSQG